METLASLDGCVDFGVPSVHVVATEIVSALAANDRQHRSLDVGLAFFELTGLFVDVIQFGVQLGEAEGFD